MNGKAQRVKERNASEQSEMRGTTERRMQGGKDERALVSMQSITIELLTESITLSSFECLWFSQSFYSLTMEDLLVFGTHQNHNRIDIS